MDHLKQLPKIKKTLALTGAAVLLLAAVCLWYVGDYYRADENAVAAFVPEPAVAMTAAESGDLIWQPEGAETGFIFYPGGKVEHRAYIPLMRALSSRGILCVLVEMPLRLAVLDMDAAEGIADQFPQIAHWYIGGHSLGGSMAAAWLGDNADRFEGLVLLGSYSTEDLSETKLEVLSILGSEDRVLNREKYGENRENLPEDFQELVIEGGCHAGFGMYGPQAGDGVPALAGADQILLTAEAIADLMAS